jgi:hypothetical protein
MGGSAAGNITIISGTVRGATGGAQTNTIAQTHLPNVALSTTVTDSGHNHGITIAQVAGGGVLTGTAGPGTSGIRGNDTGAIATGTAVLSASTSLGGSGVPFPVLPPAMILPYILRVI